MVTTVEEYTKELNDVHNDFIDRIEGRAILRDPSHNCYQLDKPVHILVNNEAIYDLQVEDKGDYYEHKFTCFGFNPKQYKDDFGWVLDKDSILYIERPYKGRVVKLLRQLLPDMTIRTVHNDIILGGYKIGPTFTAGLVRDYTSENNPLNSSLIYLLRWRDAEGLDKYFAGDPNHEKRKASNIPLGSLDMFLKNITKEQFEQMLEAME